MKHTVVGLDTVKRVFQLHWIDQETGEIVCRRLKRERLLEHFAHREPCLVGMEARGGSQHWARELIKLGHEVKLLPGKQVKPFVLRNKSDAADARDLDSGTAAQDQGGRGEDRSTASSAGATPHEESVVEIPGRARQWLERIAGRIWRGHAARESWPCQG